LGFIYQKHIDSPTFPHLGKVGQIYGNIMVEFHTVVGFCCCFPFFIIMVVLLNETKVKITSEIKPPLVPSNIDSNEGFLEASWGASQ
jgi:hypothetical protein